MKAFRPLFVLITALMLALASMSLASPATAGNGFNGDVKIHEGSSEPDPITLDDPHVCTFHLHGFNFDPGATGSWRIVEWPPTGDGKTVADSGTWGPTASGEWSSGVSPIDENGHYKLFWDQTDPKSSGGEKHKVFWVECGTEESGIAIWKYNDLNSDGSWDSNEPGLSGWHFVVTPTGGQAQEVVTDASGEAYVDVPAGDYLISEKLPLPSRWSNTQPGGAAPHYNINVPEGVERQVEFGNHYDPGTPPPTTPPTLPGTLQIVKYNDLDRNGSRGNAEPVLAGFSFQIKAGATVQLTVTTPATGIASVTLLPGVYSVTEVAATGWISTDPGGSAPTKTVTITSGQVSTVAFGNATVIIPPTSQTQITIVKYGDTNGNGARDGGEGTLSGFTFVVKAADGSVVGTATTGTDGTASIVGLPLGPYTITESPQTGWTNTDPGGAAIKVAVLTSGATTATVSFGNAEVRLPSTSTEDGTTGMLLGLALAGAGAVMLVIARRTSRAF